MEGMRNEDPCSAGSVIEEHIVEDGFANVGVKSGEGILDVDSYESTLGKVIHATYIKYQNV